MLKTIFYLCLTAVGVGATLITPLAGAISCLEAYLLNPIVLTESDLRFQLITTVAFLVSIWLYKPQGAQPVGRENSVLKALWVFVAIGALSSLWAQVSAHNAIDEIIEVAKTVLLASLLVRVICTERHLSYIMFACLVGVFHAALLHTVGIRLGYVPQCFGRESGVLPESHAVVLVLFVPTMILLAMRGRLHERLLCWCALPIVLNSIVSTYMRTYFLALVVQLVLLLMVLPRRITLRLLPVLIFGVGLFVFRLTPENYWEWISTINKPTEDASANSRFVINEASWRMLMDYPMGVGYRNYPRVSPKYLPRQFLTYSGSPDEGQRSAHNSYFTVACETGILGFAVWAYAFGGSLWQLRRIRKTSDPKNPSRVGLFAMGMEIGFCGWLMGGMTMAEHEVDPAYWFVAFTVVLTRLHHHERRKKLANT